MDREKALVIIQSRFRGWLYRSRNLPNSLRYVKLLIEKANSFSCHSEYDDGRVNSTIDEANLLKLLGTLPELNGRIKCVKMRAWPDLLIKDFKYGWLPVNIKTTTTTTSDNTGNLASCVYALTDHELDLTKKYNNGKMSMVLIDAIENKRFNRKLKKDYYFLVINKVTSEVIINSLRGLEKMNSNNYNLPYQVKWCINKNFVYRPIEESVDMLKDTIKRGGEVWLEKFLNKIRDL